jgi:hypothetical protein
MFDPIEEASDEITSGYTNKGKPAGDVYIADKGQVYPKPRKDSYLASQSHTESDDGTG